ncbi:MAG TPA: amino acid adenylation domain-containing protein, partial [Thermoanaerobaculia bacterium]|nr:amino acid adenylation domain-containing protein [Thermoanaerobaculia bacterium]
MSTLPASSEGFRLSAQQEHLWLLAAGRAERFPALASLSLEGELDRTALCAALADVVARHEILRTGFQALPGVRIPLQVIGEAPSPDLLPLADHDLSGLSPEARAERLSELQRQAGEEPFELDRPPLLRAHLARLAAGRHRLIVALPALSADRRTLTLLAAEIGRCYAARLRGGNAPGQEGPEAPAMQYADFAEWQHEILESEETAAGREHWRQLDLGTLEAHLPGVPEGAGGGDVAEAALDLPAELAARLEAVAAGLDLPLDVLLLAAWTALLQRLTDRPEVTVAVTADGRKFAELREALGLYATCLPVRFAVEPDLAFPALAGRVQAALARALAWQECFSWRPLAPADLTREPFVPFAFTYEAETAAVTAAGLTIAVEEASVRHDRSDAELRCIRSAGGLRLALRHALPAAPAERLAGEFLDLLASLAGSPGAVLADLSALSEPERRLFAAVNATAHPFPDDCFHRRFEARAARTPAAPAVLHAGGELSYGELDRQADRLARHLRRLGVGPEVRVPLCLARSPEMIVAILAIFKAGGAYVPIDPSYPAEHRAFMIGESDAPVLLTLARHREELAGHGRPLLCLDTGIETAAAEEGSGPAAAVTPENLAYVIYTSGSTGRPKGVLVSHRNLVHSTAARLLYYRAPVASFLLLSSFAFDSSVAGIFGTLAAGGALVLPEDEAQRDVLRLTALLGRHRISHLLCLPSLYAAILDAAASAATAGMAGMSGLAAVIVAGEACPAALVERHARLLPGTGLYNEYGPTEATVWSTVHRLDPGPGEVLIGRPIANVEVHLLGPRMLPVPLGVAGELYVGGSGITRGYHARPELTAERFLPDPWTAVPGGRLYRTGDLVRQRADGALEFLGRADDQVKIRGHRIEPAEVEATLVTHPALREGAVLARRDEPGDPRLVAYFVAEPGAVSVPELRAHLRERLPEHMVPAAFVSLPTLPRTPNGKVDRRALPAPGAEPAGLRSGYLLPVGVVEEVIADVWGDVLRLSRVAATESFFDLGGHSLLATQVVSRLREAFGVDLTLLWLFEGPTVRQLAARVEAARRAEAGIDLPPIERADRTSALPLSFAQRRLWFLQQLDPESSVYNVPAWFKLEGALDRRALAGAFGEVARRHEVLRTRFPAAAGEPAQLVLPAAPVPLPRVDLSGLPEAARRAAARRLAAEEVRRPFDLEHGPVLRLLLLQLGEEEHALGLHLHHVVSDGWSFDLLVHELTAFYATLAAGVGNGTADLPELALQYADFAVWQRGWLAGERLEAELAFWRAELAGAPPVLDLATDRPRPAVQSFRGSELGFALGRELSDGLLALGRAEAATPFMTLLAAFWALLSRESGQLDLAVGAPIAGRNRREIEPLIGFFVNTLVLRAELGGDPEFREVVRQARRRTLAAHAHQDLPFEKLVEELAPERSLAHTPLFQAVLAWQHPAPPAGEIAGLRLKPIEVPSGTVKFDLMLSLKKTPAGLSGALSYADELYDPTTVERLLGHLTSLLRAARENPSARLSELPLLAPAESHQLVHEWTEREAPGGVFCLHERFQAVAARQPAALALEIEAPDESPEFPARLTYGELDRLANQLAHHLRTLGVGPEVRVALRFERSSEMVVAILATLKAGGAYVPIDPGHPAERQAFMLADSGATVLLTLRTLAERLPAGQAVTVFLDEIGDLLSGQSAEPPAAEARPENLAYVIYTSGSTGQPKGSPITHANVARLFAATEPRFRFGPEDAWTLFHSDAFDFSVWEIWGALLHGGRLVLVPFWVSRSPERFRGLLARRGITVLNQTPSAFRQLVQVERALARAAGSPALALRLVIFGGEALDLASLAPWFEIHGDRVPELVNMYGITETTVHVTWRTLSPADLAEAASPIGVPLPHLAV